MTDQPDYRAIADDIRTALDRAGLDPNDHTVPVALTLGGPELSQAVAVRSMVAALFAATEGAYRADPEGEYGPTALVELLKAHPDRSVRWLGGLFAEVVEIEDEAWLESITGTDQGSETEPTYAVHRFYFDDTPTKTIATGLTLDEARAHCQRPDTRGDGWFDGYDLDE